MPDQALPASLSPDETGPTSAPAPPISRKSWKRRMLWASLVLLLLIAALVLPPLVNISRYQRQITALMARSLGRPVHLSSVELRLLPTPGFVLHDLQVSEDPAFGAEPILSARTVVASVRLWSLWPGRLQISRISVDEASLNLVRSPLGRWNLQTLMLGPAQPVLTGKATQPSGKPLRFPYLEATNSRVNLKNGLEKSPFSIVNADLSFWQEESTSVAPSSNSGEWRLRLKGQPVRTDMELSPAGPGEVRVELTLHSAAQLRQMPLRLQLEWRDAELGQLSRLLLGSDAGWRGEMTADIDVQGTADSALTRARLRATGVHREEFAPDTPLDLDANCNFTYQHSHNAFHKLACDTAIGSGQLHLTGELPGTSGPSHAMLEVTQIPLQAGLDLMRTVRSGFAPGISAKGTLSGSLTYQQPDPAAPNATNLQGQLLLKDSVLSGGQLTTPITLPQITFTPAAIPAAQPGPHSIAEPHTAIQAKFSLPLAGAPVSSSGSLPVQPITLRLALAASGYQLSASGSADATQLRELAYAFGLPHQDALDGFGGHDPAASPALPDAAGPGLASLDLTASGPWIATPASTPIATTDSLAGSIQLHRVQWQAPYLNRPVELTQATATLTSDTIALTSDFTYGNLKGSLDLTAPANCQGTDCESDIQLHLGAIDAEAVKNALLAPPVKKTLLSPLMARMRPAQKPDWPTVTIHAQADTLLLGPITLRKPSLTLNLDNDSVDIEHWEATLFDGVVQGTGNFQVVNAKPQYTLDGTFTHLNPAQLGNLLSGHWSGEPLDGKGSIQLTGLTEKDITASAHGQATFHWPHGALPLRFDSWTGTLTFADGKLTLGQNDLTSGRKHASLTGSAPYGGPVKLTIPTPK